MNETGSNAPERAVSDPGAQNARQRLRRWSREAGEVKEVYPDFDLAREAKNAEFTQLLKGGVSVRKAYEVVHLKELLENAARDAEKRVLDGIRARAGRPAENGVSAHSGLTVRADVKSLTADQRRDIARRAGRGEKISF